MLDIAAVVDVAVIVVDIVVHVLCKSSGIIFGVGGGEGGSDWNGDRLEPLWRYTVRTSSSMPFSVLIEDLLDVAIAVVVAVAVALIIEVTRCRRGATGGSRDVGRLRPAPTGTEEDSRLHWFASVAIVAMRTASEAWRISASCSGPVSRVIASYRVPMWSWRRLRLPCRTSRLVSARLNQHFRLRF